MRKFLLKYFAVLLLAVPFGLSAQMSDLIISEYGESGGNDYLEIYNGTGADVDLTQYYMTKIINDGSWGERQFQLLGTLPHGHTLNFISYKADSLLLIKADTLGPVSGVEGSDYTFLVTNGNEAFGIAKVLTPGDTVLIDKIGEESTESPASWDCAGITGAAKEHVWVRKPTVTGPNADWESSAGTNEDDSEWIIFDANTWGNIGYHTEYNSAFASDIFISEYADYGNNDYLEIYNGTGAEVDMSNYMLRKIINDGNWGERDFLLSGTLPHGKAYTIIKYSADSLLVIKADTNGPTSGVDGSDFTFMVTNGNEAFALAKINAPGDTVLIDKFGEESTESPASWDVAGVSEAAKDHVLVRKSTVGGPNADWESSAGTDTDNSEWIIHSADYWRNVGKHSMYLGSSTVYVDVTFSVNMNQETVSGDGVFLAGSFQGWSTSANPMSDTDGDGIYTLTVSVEANSTYEYKFINGSSWETVPSECVQNGNRYFSVEESDLEIGTVCFNSCNDCSGVVSVTFRVNMNEETVSSDGVHIAGSFQGWDPSTTSMTDSDGDGIYEYTVDLGGNTTYEYKFVNGASWGFDESVPSECSVNNNRGLTVATASITTEAFCYGTCSACTSGLDDTEFENSLHVYPNPSNGQFEVMLDITSPTELELSVYSIAGQLIQCHQVSFVPGDNSYTINMAEKGLYLIEVSGDEGRIFRKVVIE